MNADNYKTSNKAAHLGRLLSPHRVLAILDLENIEYGARDKGGTLNVANLTMDLCASGATHMHAISSATPRMLSLKGELERNGWHINFRDYRNVGHRQGRGANADNCIATLTGILCAKLCPSALWLITGDGDLGSDIAWCVSRQFPRTDISVLGFPESLSTRLRPEIDPNITGAYELCSSFVTVSPMPNGC